MNVCVCIEEYLCDYMQRVIRMASARARSGNEIYKLTLGPMFIFFSTQTQMLHHNTRLDAAEFNRQQQQQHDNIYICEEQ